MKVSVLLFEMSVQNDVYALVSGGYLLWSVTISTVNRYLYVVLSRDIVLVKLQQQIASSLPLLLKIAVLFLFIGVILSLFSLI